MLKKLPSSLVLLLLATVTYGQTIVSTTPENKKVVLEEFTGIHCVFCPQGHAIAQAIQDNNPGDVFLINIHTGSFANPSAGEPDFRTPFGSAIAAQSGLIGYPAGTVNRHIFPGQSQSGGNDTAMSRNQWTSAANATLGLGSYVNVGVEASIDVQTNVLTVHVEAYYTGNSPQATNLLNVALLQNNTLGPQTGGGMGDQYVHQHRLVHLITGQWGVSISPTTTGSFIDQTFTYTIPADYNGVPTELADMEIVAFITETQQELPSGAGAYPTYTGITNANDANLRSVTEIPDQCGTTIAPVVNIQNLGANPLTTLDITYSVNGGTPAVYTWTGNLTSLQNENVELPAISYTMQATNTVDISVPNDDVNTNNTQSTTFDEALESTGTVYMTLNTDDWGEECTWNVKDFDGNILYSGGPYADNIEVNETFQLAADCYTFNLIDSYGDGGGAVSLVDAEGTTVYSTNGNYGSGESKNFSTNGALGIEDLDSLYKFVVYPNPAQDQLFIVNAENATIELYDMLGKLILTQSNISSTETLSVSRLQNGTYFLKVTSDNSSKVEKIVISK
ncbi:T9SS type A sorting domain-containing protein [Altibacter sp.]|uniref:T9SS type A sorting domain-containing protein n=1 Tax=Altibacter sp. TaxID=2024823 RepID=UPI002586225E|nr:T9SS type A sorting domain-containing protein [Altibacter sp.]MCW9037338.1 T9SS type A sorting domain-containing protein [Altibacter sp.]